MQAECHLVNRYVVIALIEMESYHGRMIVQTKHWASNDHLQQVAEIHHRAGEGEPLLPSYAKVARHW
jgi:hypothetical protein